MSSSPISVPADVGSDEEIEVVGWGCRRRATVEAGEVVAQIATAKTEVEVESPATGEIHYSAAIWNGRRREPPRGA